MENLLHAQIQKGWNLFQKRQADSKAAHQITWACRVNLYRASLLNLMLSKVHDAVGLFMMPSVHDWLQSSCWYYIYFIVDDPMPWQCFSQHNA